MIMNSLEIKTAIDDLSVAETSQLEDAFNSRTAARQLALSSRDSVLSGEGGDAQILRALILSETTIKEVVASRGERPMPLGLMAFIRASMAQSALATSMIANAASTTDDHTRMIGPYELQIIDEEDALFLLIEYNALPMPRRLELLLSDGRTFSIDLPSDADGVSQSAISRQSEDYAGIAGALRDPETSLFLLQD